MAEKDTVLNQTYTQLIEKAIADFDAIGGVLVNRGLIANMTDGSVKTEAYAGLMRDHLFTVGDNLTVTDVGNANITDKRAATVAGGESTISYTGNAVNFTIKGGALGLYGPNSTLTGSFTGVTEVLSGDLSAATGVNITKGESAYVVTPKENEVIKSLSINKAAVTLNVVAEQAEGTQTGDATVAFGTTGLTSGTFATTTPTTGDYVEITSKAEGQIKGKISATASAKAVTGGYIASKDEIEDVSIANTEYSVSVNKTESLWIKKTSVPTLTTSTTNEITATAASGVLLTGTATSDYVITLSSPAITYSAEMEAGYLAADSDISVAGSAGEGVAYIKAGAVGTISKEIGIAIDSNKSSLNLNSNQTGAYEIVLKLAEGNTAFDSKTYTSTNGVSGFVSDGNTTTTITGASKTLKIAKAVENLSGTVTIKTTHNDSPFLLNDTGEYKLTVDADGLANISRNVTTDGYVKSGDTATNNIGSTARTFSIKQFAGSLGTSLTSTLVNGSVNDGAGENELKSAIIFNQAEWDKLSEDVKNGDHYTLQSNATINGFTAGYMATKLADANQTYYLPKAKVEYSVDDNENEILHVTQGGYLPAGFIGEITNAGKLQQAEFTISATTTGGIIKSGAATEGEDVYRIALSKTVSRAGYVGNAEGIIANADLLYVEHGKVSGTTAAGTISLVAPVAQTIDSVKKYVITASNTATATISVTEGYVKTTDIKVDGKAQENGGAINITSSGDIKLDVATLKIDNATGVTLVPDTNVELVAGTGTSAYTIGAVVADNSTMILDAKSAGYIMPGDKTSGVAVTTDTFTTTTKYIKAGEGVTIALTADQVNKELLQSDFATTKAEGVAYTISVKSDAVLATDATVGTGYYGATEVAAAKKAQNLNISGAIKAISVPHGKATITGTGTMNLTADGLALHENTGEGYHVITLGYTDTTQAATVTEGYVKSGEVVYTAGTVGAAATYSIKDKGTYTATAGNGDGNNKQTVIDTAGTYSSQNITVTLHADATGSAVDVKLLELQNRLNGF